MIARVDKLRVGLGKILRAEEISRSYSGLGIGLYIASKIVNAHGGRIWIDSELDVGSSPAS